MKWISKKRLQSVLGISLDGHRLCAAHVRRTKNAVEVLKSTSATLTLDASHQEIELVGREIRNVLDAAGLSERNCIAAVPVSWLMSHSAKLPELSREDAQSFLDLEAERSFPVGIDQLQIARSTLRPSDPSGAHTTLLAARKEQLDRLFAVLRSAGLKPIGFTLGLAALPDVLGAENSGRVTLAVEVDHATLLVTHGTGVIAFRTSDATFESEAGERVLNASAIARELRLTLEQVPAELRPQLHRLLVVGDEGLVRPLAEALGERARSTGLVVESQVLSEGRLNALVAEQIATRYLMEGPPSLEFLPPRPSRLSALVNRYHSKRLATIGSVAAAAALVVAAMFGWQSYRLWKLHNEWDGMKTQVGALDTTQSRIREYRSWYDTAYPNLTILRRVTEAFPENGIVTAKSFEIHAATNISINGITRDNTALLRTLDQLRKVPEVQSVKVEQISGKSPAPFNFTFRWNGNTGT